MLDPLVFVFVLAACLLGIYGERWRVGAGQRAWLARRRPPRATKQRRRSRQGLQLAVCLTMLAVLGGLGLAEGNIGRRSFLRCAQAASAGYGQMKRGDETYRPWLDADNDGIACEWNPKARVSTSQTD